jgi:hypothetical protein
MANLGFLLIAREPTGYVGGYLVTNQWGRPLEFRLSSAVQPNRVQQILYGDTLEPYVCGELIGKALVEKASVPAGLIVTDRAAALDLRLRLDAPVVWLALSDDAAADGAARAGLCVRSAANGRDAVYCHAGFPEDAAAVRALLEKVDGMLDPAEPFARIREAMAEARKMGVTRAA